MTYRVTLVLLAVFALGAVPVAAQEAECHSNDRFLVAGAPNADFAGNRFAVTAVEPGAAAPACRFDERTADFVIGGSDEPLWFAGLEGRHLVLTESTGPHGQLIAVDLEARERILDVPADEFALTAEGIAYWERKEAGTAANCAQFAELQSNGLNAVIAHETRFDFAARRPEPTGKTRCDAMQ